MKTNSLLLILIAAAATSFTAFSPAGADTDYYHSAAYQAEEQAFRARQNEGAQLTETYGANSPQYQDWYAREHGTVSPYNSAALYNQGYYPSNQAYYANVNAPRSYSNPFERRFHRHNYIR